MEGTDLLLIDTGDRVDGNGLYDASNPKGKYTFDIVKEQQIDIICTGNHELYKRNASENEYLKTVPNFQGNYIASNVDILDPKTGDRVPLAQRYKKFTTKNQGVRILAFGFIFDFTGNANNTKVLPVSETIKEQWFQDAIRDREVDLFLIVGHVPLRSEEFELIFKAIRKVQWDVPMQFFGGHTHVRDYTKYDSKAYALESGRYMETIGFMSVSGLNRGGKSRNADKDVSSLSSVEFARRYIDNNLFSFYHHTSLNSTSFPTSHGRNVTSMISSARQTLELDSRLGCAPQNLWTHRAPHPSNHSIFTWLQEQVFPDSIYDKDRGDIPTMVLVNTGSVRFDIFRGAFTVDSTYIVYPFENGFRFIKDVPFSVAKKLLVVLNVGVPQIQEHVLRSKSPVSSQQLNIKQEFVTLKSALPLNQVPLTDEDPNLIPGYTTTDDAGSDGDDTIHSPIKFYQAPNCIESRIRFPSIDARGNNTVDGAQDSEDPETVDLVYLDFLHPYFLSALQFLGTDYKEEDTNVYMKGANLKSLITNWVKNNWSGSC